MKPIIKEDSGEHSMHWGIRILPGLFITILIILARALGLLESLELVAFDYFLKLRPLEEPDRRITIIRIEKEDIQRWGGYPIANQKIASIIELIQEYQPTAIGLNLLEDVMDDDSQSLVRIFHKYDNVVIAEKILPPQIKAPTDIPEVQVGFVDISLDRDGHLRRGLLGTFNPINLSEFKFSFSIRLAEKYLQNYGYQLENGIKNPDAMRFGDIEIPLLDRNFGSYIAIDDGGFQTLINFQNHPYPFLSLSIHDIQSKNIIEKKVKNKLVLIGVTDAAIREPITTAITPTSSQYMEGIYVQAHSTNQLLRAVLDQSHLLKAWIEPIEYTWIIVWSAVSILLIFLNTKEKRYLLDILLMFMSLISVSYVALLNGYWIPLIPQILIFIMSVTAHSIINKQQQIMIQKEKLKLERQKYIQKEKIIQQEIISKELKHSIEQTFTIIHNGPLQDLYSLIRDVRDQSIQKEDLIKRLVKLDRSIRDIGDHLIKSENSFCYLGEDEKIDLELPTHEMLYEVFRKTLERDFAVFKEIKIKLRSFSPMPDYYVLDINMKRELCHFLAEMLCNVAKHAFGCSYITAIGEYDGASYSLSIEDDGVGIQSAHRGQGTNLAQRLAKRLDGTFSREPAKGEQGTCCQLRWPVIMDVESD